MVLEKADKMLVDDSELLDESKHRKDKSSEFLEESRIQEQVSLVLVQFSLRDLNVNPLILCAFSQKYKRRNL